jgi:hypothetical protein
MIAILPSPTTLGGPFITPAQRGLLVLRLMLPHYLPQHLPQREASAITTRVCAIDVLAGQVGITVGGLKVLGLVVSALLDFDGDIFDLGISLFESSFRSEGVLALVKNIGRLFMFLHAIPGKQCRHYKLYIRFIPYNFSGQMCV